MEDGYIDLRALSKRTSLSPRTLRAWVTDPERPLPAYRVRGKLLFRWVEVARWLDGFRVATVDVDAIIESLRASRKGTNT